jgi:hypothetical protein
MIYGSFIRFPDIVRTIVMRRLCLPGESGTAEEQCTIPGKRGPDDEVEGVRQRISFGIGQPGKNEQETHCISDFSIFPTKWYAEGTIKSAGNAGLIPAGRNERRLQWLSGNDWMVDVFSSKINTSSILTPK